MVSISNFMHEWLSSKVALLSAEKESAKAGYCKLMRKADFWSVFFQSNWKKKCLLSCYPASVTPELFYWQEIAWETPGNVAEVLKIPSSSFRTQISQHMLQSENEMSQLLGKGEMEPQDPGWDGMSPLWKTAALEFCIWILAGKLWIPFLLQGFKGKVL